MKTLLIDKRDIGMGSTSASTALLQYEIDVLLRELVNGVGPVAATRSYPLCRDAIGKLERLAADGQLRRNGGPVGSEAGGIPPPGGSVRKRAPLPRKLVVRERDRQGVGRAPRESWLERGCPICAINHDGEEFSKADFDHVAKTAAELLASKRVCTSLGIKAVEEKFRSIHGSSRIPGNAPPSLPNPDWIATKLGERGA